MWRDRKVQRADIKVNRNIIRAEKMLDEVKELAQILRPFIRNGAIMLGESWDDLMADQISLALSGAQRRIVTDEDGVPVMKDGEVVMTLESVPARDQAIARQKLIELFPKLIPETAKQLDRDPLLALAEELQKGGGGKLALEVQVTPHEPEPNIVEGVARIIDDDESEPAIELDSANA